MIAAATIGSTMADAAGTRYKSWKQYSSSWSSLTLGNSGETVRQSGCAVVSAAMLMVKSGSVTDPDFDPAVIVSYLNRNGGFSDTGDIQWSKLSGYAPSFRYLWNESLYGTQAQRTEEIASLLSEGYYLIAGVDYGSHFVAIDSVENGRVTMLDPASGMVYLFDRYAAAGVTSLRVFAGADTPVMQPAPFPVQPEASEVPAPLLLTDPTGTEELTAPDLIILTDMPTFLPNPPAPFLTEVQEPTAPAITEDVPETPPAPFLVQAADDDLPAPALTAETPEAPPLPAEDDLEPAPMPVLETPAMPVQEAPSLWQTTGTAYFMQIRLYTTDALNLRMSPDTGSTALLVIPAGTDVVCTAFNDDGTWGLVSYGGFEGWISLDYTTL